MNEIQTLGIMTPFANAVRERSDSARPRGEAEDAFAPTDRVEISDLARFFSQLADLPADRARKIVDVRSAILTNTYESDAKLSVAVDRLLSDVA